MVRVDLHVHSSASFDCSVEPEQVAWASLRCFSPDHDSIAGALRLRATERVVVGDELLAKL